MIKEKIQGFANKSLLTKLAILQTAVDILKTENNGLGELYNDLLDKYSRLNEKTCDIAKDLREKRIECAELEERLNKFKGFKDMVNKL